ncbi:MAG: zinc ribbon domain-containing protein [Actinobacteria bacterium]|nr:zinc ribbon domain-containing protein [Actinomycetota bacterium]
MPMYDLRCSVCQTTEEVILLHSEEQPVTCSCGGALHRVPSRFVTLRARGDLAAATRPTVVKACGHASACQCAVRLARPNPFADRLPTTRNVGSESGENDRGRIHR